MSLYHARNRIYKLIYDILNYLEWILNDTINKPVLLNTFAKEYVAYAPYSATNVGRKFCE